MKKRKKKASLRALACVLGVPAGAMLTGALAVPESLEAAVPLLKPWLFTGLLLAGAHLLLRPLLRLLNAPLGCVTLGLSGFAIDVGLYWLAAYLSPEFAQPEPVTLIVTALLINLLCAAGG